MPSILTHHYFADLLIKKYQKDWTFLKEFASLVWVGSQGPDPLFFFGRAPFKKRLGRETINAFASTLHGQLPIRSLGPLLEAGWYVQDQDPLLKAYVFGALSHYVLDRVCHPYIFYRSGFDEQGQLTGHFNADHARLEVEIDLAIVQKQALSPMSYQPKVTLSVEPMQLSKISELYAKSFPKLMNFDTYRHAVEDMRATYRFLYHGSWLNRLLVILLAGKRSLPFSLIHPTRIRPELAKQALNLSRKTWLHPVTKTSSQQSFMNLLDEALTLFEAAILLLQQKRYDAQAWTKFTENIDYDGKLFASIMQVQSPYPR